MDKWDWIIAQALNVNISNVVLLITVVIITADVQKTLSQQRAENELARTNLIQMQELTSQISVANGILTQQTALNTSLAAQIREASSLSAQQTALSNALATQVVAASSLSAQQTALSSALALQVAAAASLSAQQTSLNTSLAAQMSASSAVTAQQTALNNSLAAQIAAASAVTVQHTALNNSLAAQNAAASAVISQQTALNNSLAAHIVAASAVTAQQTALNNSVAAQIEKINASEPFVNAALDCAAFLENSLPQTYGTSQSATFASDPHWVTPFFNLPAFGEYCILHVVAIAMSADPASHTFEPSFFQLSCRWYRNGTAVSGLDRTYVAYQPTPSASSDGVSTNDSRGNRLIQYLTIAFPNSYGPQIFDNHQLRCDLLANQHCQSGLSSGTSGGYPTCARDSYVTTPGANPIRFEIYLTTHHR